MSRTTRFIVSIVAIALMVSMAVEGTMHHHGLVAHSPDCPVCVASYYASADSTPHVDVLPEPRSEYVQPVVFWMEQHIHLVETPLDYSPSNSPPTA